MRLLGFLHSLMFETDNRNGSRAMRDKVAGRRTGFSGSLRVFSLIAVVLVQTTMARAQISFRLTDLDPAVRAYAINNAGQMAGEHPVLMGGGPDDDYALYILDGGDAAAYAVNSFGDVAGNYFGTDGRQRAYLYSSGQRTDLGTLGGRFSCAYGVNDAKQVVGWSETAYEGEYFAFLYSDGVMRSLGTLGGDRSEAYGINNRGQIVGLANTLEWVPHAFLYQDGVMRDLGTLGGSTSMARAINDLGQVVGEADGADSQSHAFLYENGSMRDLGTLAGMLRSSANGINLRGEVVGRSYNLGDGPPSTIGLDWRAFLYTGGEIYDLNDLTLDLGGWRLCEAYGINDLGQVVGWGLAPDGHEHGFLLTPVPEPNSLSVVILGALLLIARRSRACPPR